MKIYSLQFQVLFSVNLHGDISVNDNNPCFMYRTVDEDKKSPSLCMLFMMRCLACWNSKMHEIKNTISLYIKNGIIKNIIHQILLKNTLILIVKLYENAGIFSPFYVMKENRCYLDSLKQVRNHYCRQYGKDVAGLILQYLFDSRTELYQIEIVYDSCNNDHHLYISWRRSWSEYLVRSIMCEKVNQSCISPSILYDSIAFTHFTSLNIITRIKIYSYYYV